MNVEPEVVIRVLLWFYTLYVRNHDSRLVHVSSLPDFVRGAAWGSEGRSSQVSHASQTSTYQFITMFIPHGTPGGKYKNNPFTGEETESRILEHMNLSRLRDPEGRARPGPGPQGCWSLKSHFFHCTTHVWRHAQPTGKSCP